MINTVELKYGGTIDHNSNFQDSDKKNERYTEVCVIIRDTSRFWPYGT